MTPRRLKISLLHHIYKRSTWQSGEYSPFDTVKPFPPPSPTPSRFENPGHTPEEEKEMATKPFH